MCVSAVNAAAVLFVILVIQVSTANHANHSLLRDRGLVTLEQSVEILCDLLASMTLSDFKGHFGY